MPPSLSVALGVSYKLLLKNGVGFTASPSNLERLLALHMALS